MAARKKPEKKLRKFIIEARIERTQRYVDVEVEAETPDEAEEVAQEAIEDDQHTARESETNEFNVLSCEEVKPKVTKVVLCLTEMAGKDAEWTKFWAAVSRACRGHLHAPFHDGAQGLVDGPAEEVSLGVE